MDSKRAGRRFTVAAVYSASCFSTSQAISTASSMQPGQLRSGPLSDPMPLSVPLVGLALGLGVFHAVAHYRAHDGHGARDGAAGFGHTAHAGAKALGESKGGLGVEPDSGRERAGDGLGAVKATGVVFGGLSLTGGDVELGRIDLLHRCLLGYGVPAYGTRDGACNHRELHGCLILSIEQMPKA